MSYFFATILDLFLPVALLAGVDRARGGGAAPSARATALTLGAAFAAGLALAWRFDNTVAAVLWWSGLGRTLAVAALLVTQGTHARRAGLALVALTVTGAAFTWGRDPNLRLLAVTHVMNTALLLNLAAIAAALALLATLAGQCRRLVQLCPAARWPLAATLGALVLLPAAGDGLLAAMKLDFLELTARRLTLVALATNFPWARTALALGAVAAAVTLAAWRRLRPLKQAVARAAAAGDALERRRRLAEWRGARRWTAASLAALALAAAAGGYWHGIAARPLALSRAQRVQLNADGEVRLPGALTTLADGRLHRFEWVADDGKIVRFFVINRFAGTASPTVVFDACMLCGDLGYAQEDGQVVCIACGVRIHPPSVGNAGGCNPIPLNAWGVEDGDIVIPQAALDEGARYFTTYEKDGRVTGSGGPGNAGASQRLNCLSNRLNCLSNRLDCLSNRPDCLSLKLADLSPQQPRTLNYPVASRHPFTEGELARARGISDEVGLRVSDSPSVKGCPRSGRGSSALIWNFDFEIWDLFGVWNLEFGISPTSPPGAQPQKKAPPC
ncbi:MAG: Fe-S-containing protein [Verrucomicrobiales bacterium]|jgi:uncharacterized membrane protein|nr:Fe-S-containing protein [Verrucomicrobiales bacterium]